MYWCETALLSLQNNTPCLQGGGFHASTWNWAEYDIHFNYCRDYQRISAIIFVHLSNDFLPSHLMCTIFSTSRAPNFRNLVSGFDASQKIYNNSEPLVQETVTAKCILKVDVYPTDCCECSNRQ